MDADLWKEVRFFRRSEFDSRDEDGSGVGTGDLMRPRVVFALDALRGLLGKRLAINSGYRTAAHNAAVGGAPMSAHMTGEAADVSRKGLQGSDIAFILHNARALGFTGIGIGRSFIHLDMKPRIASWKYVGSKIIAIEIGKELQHI